MKKEIEEVLTRSVDKIYPSREALEKALSSGKRLRIYMGIDPTADYIHLGHSTNYIILKRFHELGHKIIVLIGDFTARIGDPSDKSAARKRLTESEVKRNLKSFKEQIGKILNFNDKKNPIEFQFNSGWLAKLKSEELMDITSNFTVQQMIERDIFEKRLKEKKPLYLHEFFYPVFQGYDSVVLNADLEIGGSDQTFNMLAGRTLVRTYNNKEKFVMTTTLLENPVTHEKLMSKSLGTGIGIDETVKNMYGKVMALPDEAIIQCFIDCTYLSIKEIDKIKDGLSNGSNPKEEKSRLAFEIVKMYHGENEAAYAKEQFINQFQKKEMPDEIPGVKLSGNYALTLLLIEIGAAGSNAEARRLIEQGGVKIDKAKITDINAQISTHRGMIIQVGKRKFWRVK